MPKKSPESAGERHYEEMSPLLQTVPSLLAPDPDPGNSPLSESDSSALRRSRMPWLKSRRRVWETALFSAALLFIFLVFLFSSSPREYGIFAHFRPTPENASERWHQFIHFDVSSVLSSDGARRLPSAGSLFCYVVTSPKYHSTRVISVNETWLPECDHGEFFTSVPQPQDDRFSLSSSIPFSFVFEGIPDEYVLLFHKTMSSLQFLYQRYPQFDWYYKADDDTFVIVENLRAFLGKLNPEKPSYIGYRMKPYLKHGYNSGGAGYVLSRAALRLFNEHLLAGNNPTACPFSEYEDVGIAKCLESLGIVPIDTRNSRLQQRFNAYSATDIFEKRIGEEWVYDPQIGGEAAMAADLVSLHHVSPQDMRTYHQLVHKVGRALERRRVNRTG